MQKPPLDPDVADTAPSDSVLTAYDQEHLITYQRLLDADVVARRLKATWTSSWACSTCAISARCTRTSPCPIRQAIKFSSVAGSLARRRQASAR